MTAAVLDAPAQTEVPPTKIEDPRPIEKYRLRPNPQPGEIGCPVGDHRGIDPRTGKERTWKAGNIVESREPLDKIFPDKFVLLDVELASHPALPPGSQIWDPAKESIEEFVKRVKPAAAQAAVATKTPEPPQPRPLPNFEQLTVKDLQEFAAVEEIDLGGATDKRKIITTLTAALKSRPTPPVPQ